MSDDLDAIRDAYERLVSGLEALQRSNLASGIDQETGLNSDQACRLYYEAMADLVRLLNEPTNWNRDDQPVVPVPRYLVFEFGRLLDDLLAGRVPPSIRHLFFGAKRPGISSIQQRSIDTAVRYLVGVEHGFVEDPRPVRSVAELFGVSARTVERWRKMHQDRIKLTFASTGDPSESAFATMLFSQLQEAGNIYQSTRHTKGRR